jgi:hypothetical protein
MLGALVSPATIHNGPPANTNKPCRHIESCELLRDTMLAAKEHNAIDMLHFELHKTWPGTVGDASAVIALLKILAKDGLTPAVQLNGVLFPAEILEIHKETGAALVMQLRPELAALREPELLSYIERVAPAISMILMDPSAGSGQSIDLDPAIKLYQAIESCFPNQFNVGFAGGLGGAAEQQKAHTTSVVRELRARLHTNAFSVDTESKVRVTVNAAGDDVLDIALCEAYFDAARAGFDIDN